MKWRCFFFPFGCHSTSMQRRRAPQIKYVFSGISTILIKRLPVECVFRMQLFGAKNVRQNDGVSFATTERKEEILKKNQLASLTWIGKWDCILFAKFDFSLSWRGRSGTDNTFDSARALQMLWNSNLCRNRAGEWMLEGVCVSECNFGIAYAHVRVDCGDANGASTRHRSAGTVRLP